jgi:cyanate permease
VQWAICVTAAIGFAFDSYVLLMLPLFVRPALGELLKVPATDPAINHGVGLLFNLPAVAGGVFGLLGGYLTDLLGRRRVLVWSILLYAVSSLASGYSTSVLQLLFWRCGMFVGVCVEFVAAVAWLAELFPDAKQREAVIGWTQAFGSIGGIGHRERVFADRRASARCLGRAGAQSVALHVDVRDHSGFPLSPFGLSCRSRRGGGRKPPVRQRRVADCSRSSSDAPRRRR